MKALIQLLEKEANKPNDQKRIVKIFMDSARSIEGVIIDIPKYVDDKEPVLYLRRLLTPGNFKSKDKESQQEEIFECTINKGVLEKISANKIESFI